MQSLLKSLFSQRHVSRSRRGNGLSVGQATHISRESGPEILENRALLAAQLIASDTTTKALAAGETIDIPVIYTTLNDSGSPAALQSNLLSFNLHFDADALTYVESTSIFAEGIQVVPNATRAENDETVIGDDNDTATETVLVSSYSDSDFALFLGWPNSPSVSGQVLYVARFTAKAGFTGTTINFSANATGNVIGQSSEFEFQSTSVSLGTQANRIPVITSAATASVAENQTAAIDVNATDADGDTLTYAISGGADANLFNIVSATGVVTFKTAPDFEAPGDAGDDNVYNIQVTANDGTANSVPQNIAITVTNVADTGFVVTAPVGKVSSVRPTVSWTAVSGALSYDLWLNIDDGGGNVFKQLGISSSQTSFTVTQDLEFARYRVFVYANMPGGGRETAAGHTFVLDVKSQLTTIGATTATNPQFTWNRVPGASGYILFINVPGTPVTATVTDPGSGTTVSHTLTTALARNDYKWWVRPVRQIQAKTYLGPWSEASEFSTGGRTKVTSPARNSTVTTSIPTFSWPAVPGALRYEVYVSKVGTPGVLYRDPGITGTSIQARTLVNGDYKVWIRTTQADGSGVWGSGVSFTVNATTTSLVTTPLTPLNPGFDTTPLYTWTATTGATTYDIYLHNGTSSILTTGLTGTSYTPTTALAAGAWTWAIRPVNASGVGAWSVATKFSTNGLTSLLTPGANTSDTTPTFTWRPVTDAVTYEIQVDNRTTSTANVIREAGLIAPTFTPTTALTSGAYRVWVRAISSTTVGPWSVQFDFVVASVTPAEDEPDSPLTLLASVNLLTRETSDTQTGTVGAESATMRESETAMPAESQETGQAMADSAVSHEERTTPNEAAIDGEFAAVQAWLGLI